MTTDIQEPLSPLENAKKIIAGVRRDLVDQSTQIIRGSGYGEPDKTQKLENIATELDGLREVERTVEKTYK